MDLGLEEKKQIKYTFSIFCMILLFYFYKCGIYTFLFENHFV